MAFKISNVNIIDDSRNLLSAVDGSFTGIVTASRFVSNVAQGTAPISVASSTLVTNLNANFLNGFPGAYYQVANNLTGVAPASVITQSSGLTVSGNLNVSGNVSIGGTTTLVYAQQLQINDRDITLGVTTAPNGDDVSTDITANHGGISIASTVGTPIIGIPTDAANNSPSTYKQIMWVRQGHYSGFGTDAWLFNYGVSIGNTATVQNLSRLTVGAGFTVYDTYVDLQELRSASVNTSNLNATGVSTLTNARGTNLNFTGIGTIATLGSTVATLTNLGGTNVNYTGVSTLTNATGTNINFTGVGTITNARGTNLNYTGIVTAATYFVGATKVLDTVSGQVSITGIQTIDATTKSTLERELAFAPNLFDDIQVTGVSTFSNGPVLIGSGTSTGTATQRLQVTGGAYVSGSTGIGTTTPSQPLDVNGNVRFRSGIYDANNNVGAANSVLTANGSGGWSWQSLTSTGALTAITVTNDTSTATPLYPVFTSSTGTSITGVSVDSVGLSYIPSGSGSLGIGTTSPTRNLDVNGDVRIRGGIYDVNNTVGAANSVLTANGSGGWSWQPVVSGGGAAISGINVTQDDTGVRYPLLAAGTNSSTTTQYVDATALVYNTSTNCLGIGSLTPTSRLDIIGDVKVAGIVTATDFNSSSDEVLKDNITPISDPIQKVLQINGVTFNWKADNKPSMGVIAQEIEKIMPELVSNTEPKSVNYNGLIGLLIECVKEQQKQIDELKVKKTTTRRKKTT